MHAPERVDFSMIRDPGLLLDDMPQSRLNFLDLQSAIELFTPLYQLMLTDNDFWRAANSLQLDETIGIYAAKLLGAPQHLILVNNNHPLVPMSTLRAGYRLVLHGLSTEMLHSLLMEMKAAQGRRSARADRLSDDGAGRTSCLARAPALPWRVVMASRTAGRRARLSSDPVSRGRGLRYIAALALRAFRRAGRSHAPAHRSHRHPVVRGGGPSYVLGAVLRAAGAQRRAARGLLASVRRGRGGVRRVGFRAYRRHGGAVRPSTAIEYMDTRNFTEPLFVFVIMVVAASRRSWNWWDSWCGWRRACCRCAASWPRSS